MKVITDYDYIYNVIDYDYITSGKGDYDYGCDYLRLLAIIPTPDQ
jgi:hypothetical protein